MSGAFERQLYDEGTSKRDLEQATRIARYRLDPIATERCQPCRPPQPGVIGDVGVSVTRNRPLIDVESDLFRIGLKNSNDPDMQMPTCPHCGNFTDGSLGCRNCKDGEANTLAHLPSCVPITDYTRLTNPLCTGREVGVNRFQPLCMNPQDEHRWKQRSEVGICYRNVVKDNHVPCIPKLIDQTPALPTGRGGVAKSRGCEHPLTPHRR